MAKATLDTPACASDQPAIKAANLLQPPPSVDRSMPPTWIRQYQQFLEQNGPIKASILITVAVTVFSVLFTAMLTIIIRPAEFHEMLLIGLLVPVFLTPPIGYAMAQLVRELSSAHRALQRVADRDVLTDAYSRRYFMTTVTERLAMAMPERRIDSIVLLDVENFKRINDTHGHPAGDAVLKAISQCCRQLIREQDVFARFGGEEFVFLIGGATPSGAQAIIDRVRLAIRQLEIRTPAGAVVSVTASFGIAPTLDAAASVHPAMAANQLERSLAEADRALYDAKHGGKDRVMVAVPERADVAMAALA